MARSRQSRVSEGLHNRVEGYQPVEPKLTTKCCQVRRGARTGKIELRWPSDPDRGVGSARAAYLWLPEGSLLWQAVGVYIPADRLLIRSILLSDAA